MGILPSALQLRHGLAKLAGVEKVFAQFKSKLEIGRIACDPLPGIVDENLCTLCFGGL